MPPCINQSRHQPTSNVAFRNSLTANELLNKAIDNDAKMG